ncbi:hypothetical protein [Nonomuraea sp. NPDC050643]|uniref:hypothetical protein n=1 Tax=Nonomuraea sp. NPDC050643 TaxID=3155660 RepID=UPI003409C0D7
MTPQEQGNDPDPVAELVEELELHSAGIGLDDVDAPTGACTVAGCTNNCSRACNY